MQNVVVTNKRSKRKAIEKFIKSRGITNYIILDNSDDLYDSLLIETCNLHIFDYLMDMSIVNAIRDLRDRANAIHVYVTSVQSAQPYLSLTDDVQVLPEDYDILCFFWDNPACNARNVMAFEATGKSFCKIAPPRSLGQTRRLVVDMATRKMPLKYKTADGRIVNTKGPQIVISCKSKSFDLSNILKVRDQSEVYNHKLRTLDDLPEESVEVSKDTEQMLDEKKVAEKPKKERKTKAKTKPEPKVRTVKGTADSRKTGDTNFFSRVETIEPVVQEAEHELDKRVETEEIASAPKSAEVEETTLPSFKEVFARPKKEHKKSGAQKVKETEEQYVSFQGFTGGMGGVSTPKNRRAHKRTLSVTYETIAEYCLAYGYISNGDHDALMEELKDRASKGTLFGDIALERGLITEEQLIDAITSVMGIGVLTWDEIKDIKPDYSILLKERCQKYKIFKADNRTVPGADDDDDILIATTSLVNGANEMGRMFDQPIMKYTLDAYITRKLEEEV